jgi:exosortase/archaeosortase family protein
MKRLKRNFNFRNPVLRFVTALVVLIVLWKVVYNNWLVGFGINDPLTAWVGSHGASMLKIWGYNSFCQQVDPTQSLFYQRVTILLNNEPAVTIDDSCNGLELYAVWLGFLFAYGSKNLKTLPIILISLGGCFLIYLINVLRVSGLALLVHYRVPYFEYFHKYVFATFIYLIIFLMMWFWTDQVNKSNSNSTPKSV